MVPAFTGANALQCSEACTLPADVCVGGIFFPNIVWSGTGIVGCRLKPNHAVWESHLDVACGSGGMNGWKTAFSCTTGDGKITALPAYNNMQCGGLSGASTNVRWNYDNTLNWLPTDTTKTLKQAKGEINHFKAVESELKWAYKSVSGTYTFRRGDWNANPNQVFQEGNAWNIFVNGCDTQTTADLRAQCIQHTINSWRCAHGIDFRGGRCYAAGVVVPCPSHELGFRCPSGSKKGLLGLLGLIGVPFILLLCCIPLLFCCLRRKKTESDVHFATFDPLGGPCATAIPTAFAATPCAGGFAPSAVPCL